MRLGRRNAEWTEIIVGIMIANNGIATFDQIEKAIFTLELRDNVSELKDVEAQIRGTIYRNSSDSFAFSGSDLFYRVKKGTWGVREVHYNGN